MTRRNDDEIQDHGAELAAAPPIPDVAATETASDDMPRCSGCGQAIFFEHASDCSVVALGNERHNKLIAAAEDARMGHVRLNESTRMCDKTGSLYERISFLFEIQARERAELFSNQLAAEKERDAAKAQLAAAEHRRCAAENRAYGFELQLEVLAATKAATEVSSSTAASPALKDNSHNGDIPQ